MCRGWYNGWCLHHLFLEGHQILHRGLGRLCFWFVDTVFQEWWPHPIRWVALDIIYRYDHLVAFSISVPTSLLACGVVAFVLCTIPKLHWHMLLLATAFVGSSAFILGVDCYTTAGLKEVCNARWYGFPWLLTYLTSSMYGTWDSVISFPSIPATISRFLSRRLWKLNLA